MRYYCSQNLIYYSATDFDNTMANKWRYMVQQGRKVLERAELEQSVYFTSTQRKWVQKYVLLEILGHASIPWCIGWLVFGFIKIQFCILESFLIQFADLWFGQIGVKCNAETRRKT